KIDDFRRKAARFFPPDRQGAHDSFLAEKWNCKQRSITQPRHNRPDSRAADLSLVQKVNDLNRRASAHGSPSGAFTWADRRDLKCLNNLLFHAVAGPEVKLLRGFIVLVDHAAISS